MRKSCRGVELKNKNESSILAYYMVARELNDAGLFNPIYNSFLVKLFKANWAVT